MASMFFQSGGMTFREIIDARLVLEPILARLAAERAHPSLVERLMASETSTENDQAYLRTSGQFHRQIASMSGNKILNLISHAIEDIFHERVAGLLFPPEQRGHVVEAHDAIAQAIAQRDGPLAERLMHEHMVAYARYVEERHPALMDDIVVWS